jgi:hypothetical protein
MAAEAKNGQVKPNVGKIGAVNDISNGHPALLSEFSLSTTPWN